MNQRSLINEDEKSRILNLHNLYKENFIGTSLKSLLTEEEQIILGKGGDPWDYKKSNGEFFARKKGTDNWILSKGSARDTIMNTIFKEIPNKEDLPKKETTYKLYFKNSAQGNEFREWVNKWYKSIAKEYDLDISGPYNNPTINKVSNLVVKTSDGNNKKLGDIFFSKNDPVKYLSNEPGKTLPSLINTGFKINKSAFYPNEGYYVDKCTQEGCAQYTYDMIGSKFGDAWQAYQSFDAYANVSPEKIKTMETLFNNINKKGSPDLNVETSNDSLAKKLLVSLVPNQNKFKGLGLGTVVGLYYPESKNYDLAFFQSAIGRFRDDKGKWYPLRPSYFCSDPNKCDETRWKEGDIGSSKTFKAGKTLSSGKSFMPNTHLGFIGYIDEDGERYVVHNVHKTVYAYPISKMIPGETLSIVWAGDPNQIK